MTSPHPRLPRPSGRGLALAGALTELALAAGLGILRATNSTVGEQHAEGSLPAIAFVVVLAAPGVVALLGLVIRRPVLFGAAGLACAPLAIISIAAFPIALPALLLLLAFVRGENALPSEPLITGGVLAGFTALVTVAIFTLINHTGQFTYNAPGGGSESGEFITAGRALTSIAIALVAIVSATGLALLDPRAKRRAAA